MNFSTNGRFITLKLNNELNSLRNEKGKRNRELAQQFKPAGCHFLAANADILIFSFLFIAFYFINAGFSILPHLMFKTMLPREEIGARFTTHQLCLADRRNIISELIR